MKKILKSELFKENNSLKKRIDVLEKEIKKLNNRHFELKNIDSGNIGVHGIGSAKVFNPNILVFNLSYIKKLLKSYEILFADEKQQVKFIFERDYPLIIGEYDEKKQEAIGLMLAPIVDRG